MGLGNTNDTSNKLSNFNYQSRLLRSVAITNTELGALGGTLLSILASLSGDQEFEQNLVMDLGGVGCPSACPTYLQVRIFDQVNHVFNPPTYYDASGAVVVPVGPLEIVNPQYTLQDILTQETAINTILTAKLDITQTALANLLRGISTKDLTTLDSLLDARLGSLTETAPVTDTASSGLSGRAQRIAQRITSLIALLPTSLGQGTMATSFKVVLPSDQSAIPVTYPTGTETPSASVVSTGGSVAAGKIFVAFTTDSSFVGTILGVARNASTRYEFPVTNPGKTLAAIVYTISAGSMIIDVTA